MVQTLTPTTPDQLREAIAWALADKVTLEIIGQGSKRAFGHAVAADHVLDLSKLSGILFYQPEELVISALAGTPLAEIYQAFEQHHQQFQFEPGNFPALLGRDAAPAAGTLGGLFACNISGPRRMKNGAARDHLLGFEAISGRAEDFKSGGRVMKNVTGFDLSKLMAGSFGTLGVMHTLTVKVMPRPEKTRTVLVACDDVVRAGQAMTVAMMSENEVSGAAWLSVQSVDGLGIAHLEGMGAVIALRLEGPEESVAWRCKALRELMTEFGTTEELHSTNSLRLWQAVADLRGLDGADGLLWRISVPPAQGGAVARALVDQTGGAVMLDWAGGLIWLKLDGADPMEGVVRQMAGQADGLADLVRAPDDARARVSAFHPAAPALARINARIRENFDPHHILNPGRLAPISQG
jgi:glycolate oxidase FAD binding subunit